MTEQSQPWRYKPFRPYSLQQLTERLTKEGLEEYAEWACAYAINDAVITSIGERSTTRVNKWRKNIALTYQAFLVGQLLGKEIDVQDYLRGTRFEAFLQAYGKHRKEWEDRGGKHLPQGMEAAYNFVTWISKKKEQQG